MSAANDINAGPPAAAGNQADVGTTATNGYNANGVNNAPNGVNGTPSNQAAPHANPHAAGGVNHEANFEVVTDGRRKRNNDAEEKQKEHDKDQKNQEKEEERDGEKEGKKGQQANGTNEGDGDTANAAPSGTGDDPKPPARHGTAGMKEKYKNQKNKIKDKTKPEGGFDTTPVPDAAPGYTVRFTFHRATNLPAADVSTQASDPFCIATLTTALPKRHKEDPNLAHRTPTIRNTLEPQWEDSWTVANVPASGFKLKVRIYDEDWPDHNDRLGNVTVIVHRINEQWTGFPVADFEVKKRAGSKRAYLVKAATTALHRGASMTPRLFMSAEVLGLSESQPNAHMYTLGPTFYFRHFSPMIGRLAGLKVNKDEEHDHSAEAKASALAEERDSKNNKENGSKDGGRGQNGDGRGSSSGGNNKTQKYDFQANEIQLQGPVPPKLYHRYVEFRPMIGMMFSRSGLRGRILHKVSNPLSLLVFCACEHIR